jgi:RNA polymerase sigma-70 factor (ECF subfamily)
MTVAARDHTGRGADAGTGASADPRFESLVTDYGPKVYALALRLCRNSTEAEDAVQDTFLQAMKSWGSFRGDSKPSTWLYTIAVRACRRRRRALSRQRVPALGMLMPFRDTTVADMPSGAPSPEEIQEEAELEAALQRAIVRLPEAFRLAVVLKDILELPTEDVASVLGVKHDTVKTRVHRARLMLRKSIVKSVPQRAAPPPSYERQVCIDLLRAKLDAMDHGRGFPLAQEVICERCRSVFAELDITQNACGALASGEMPTGLNQRLRELVHTGTNA